MSMRLNCQALHRCQKGTEGFVGPMSDGQLQDLKHAAQAVWQETHASLAEGRQRMQDQHSKSDSCRQVISMLKGLPDRPSHDIMLPLGKAAFLPARLTDTERCHVTLGENAVHLMHNTPVRSTCPTCMQQVTLPLTSVRATAWRLPLRMCRSA